MTQNQVILCHFGGPTKKEQVRPFLKKLFLDPFIIRASFPDFFRRFLAERISSKRWEKSNAQYEEIGYSPINHYTEVQAKHLEKQLKAIDPNTKVFVVNRYTEPFAEEVVKDLSYAPGTRNFLVSLYPHFCHSTTASSFRDFELAFRDKCKNPGQFPRRVYSWWCHPSYLDFSYQLLQKKLSEVSKKTKKITVLFSAHGLPKRYVMRGDPYYYEITGHFQELQNRANAWIKQDNIDLDVQWNLGFQSRVGRVEWVGPYTEDAIQENADPERTIVLVPISFVSDHIETLHEMDIEYKELALKAGFADYDRVEAANEDPKLAECLVKILQSNGF